jgi:hypothetical protein
MCAEVAGEDLRDGMSFELEGREERIALDGEILRHYGVCNERRYGTWDWRRSKGRDEPL